MASTDRTSWVPGTLGHYFKDVHQGKFSCVYVRWLDTTNEFYVGQTKHLGARYSYNELNQLIYWEELEDPIDLQIREAELLRDFRDAGLPLANKHMLREPVTKNRYPLLSL